MLPFLTQHMVLCADQNFFSDRVMLVSYSFALIVAIFWGVGAHMERYVLESMSNVSLFIVFGLVYFIVAIIIYVFNYTKIHHELTMSNVPFAILTALVSSTISILIYQKALSMCSVKNVHIVTALAFTAPLFTMIVTWLYFKERMSIKSVAGVCLIISGGVLLVMNS